MQSIARLCKSSINELSVQGEEADLRKLLHSLLPANKAGAGKTGYAFCRTTDAPQTPRSRILPSARWMAKSRNIIATQHHKTR